MVTCSVYQAFAVPFPVREENDVTEVEVQETKSQNYAELKDKIYAKVKAQTALEQRNNEVFLKDLAMELDKIQNQDAKKKKDATSAEVYINDMKLDEMQKQRLNQARKEGDENSVAAEGYGRRGYQRLNKARKEGDENSVKVEQGYGYPVEVEQGYPVEAKQGYPVEVEQGYPVEVEQGYPVEVEQGYPVEVEQGYPVEVEQGYHRKVNAMGPGYRKVIAMILDEMKKIKKQHLQQAIQEERDTELAEAQDGEEQEDKNSVMVEDGFDVYRTTSNKAAKIQCPPHLWCDLNKQE